MKTHAFILVLSLVAASALAEPVDVDTQYFHPAASLFIRGDSNAASNRVANGLALFPNDEKLLRLKELLEKQQEQEQENQDQQDQQQNEEQQEQNDDEPPQQDQENQEQQEEPNQDKPAPQEQEPQTPEPQSAEQMSPEEAKQLLDSMRQEEEKKRLQLHPVMGTPVKVDKDW